MGLVPASDHSVSTDLTPPQIEVWVCPTCGYWRREKSTGVHMIYPTNGGGVRHPLVKAAYIFVGEAAPDEEQRR